MPGTPAPTAPARAGLGASLRAGLNAGLLTGAVFGLLDGLLAGWRTSTLGAWNWLGCLGASVVVYGLVWIAALVVAAVVLHPGLRRRAPAARLVALNTLGLGLGCFFELYWWSREAILSGTSATDPRRLAVSLGLLILGLGLGRAVVALGARLGTRVLWVGAACVPLLWMVGGVYLFGQRSSADLRGRVNERTRNLPNVLLVVVDALRQDVLGCYGNERVSTPVFDGLAERGVLFENAWVQAPFTWTSFGSILTGKYPRRHGLMRMQPGVRMAPNITLPWHLKSAAFADRSGALSPDDYAAAAFLTGTLSHGSGLMRGFDVYFEAMVGHDLVDLDSPWSVFSSELVLSLLATKLEGKLLHYLDEDPVASMARDWFGSNGRRRFVSMVHFYSTHTPYDPQARFAQMYVDPSYSGPIRAFYSEYREAIESGDFKPTPADEQQIRNLYYAGVSQADAMLGEILAELEAQGVLDNTLVILTADHGEELGDHDLWEHNFMYETNLRVPLLMALPGRLPAGVRSDALVESTDIVPTVCGLLGILPPHEEGLEDELGRSRGSIDGLDLGALVRGEVPSVREFAFAENGVYMAVRDRRWKLVLAGDALEAEDWRAEVRPGVRVAELFDLQTDPLELINAIADAPDEALRLLGVLREWDARMPVPRSDVMESDRDIEASANLIRALGYSGGVGAIEPQPEREPR